MIGTLKLSTDFSCMLMDPKLLGSVFNNMPKDAVIAEISIYDEILNIRIKSEFFTKDGDIIVKFQRDHSKYKDRLLPLTHDHFVGLDFSDVGGE